MPVRRLYDTLCLPGRARRAIIRPAEGSDAPLGTGSYDEALRYICSRPRFSRVPGLGRLRRLLDELENPHEGGRYVHVGGTNGKGSVSVFAATIAAQAGLKTGLYTSPHLEHLEERIAVDGKPISRDDLVTLVSAVAPAVQRVEEHFGEPVIEFELLTALAFVHFRSTGCALSVLEVGLGGRYDATNVIECPEASVIATIGRDHTEVLGNSLTEIAGEKAGIIKQGAPVITAVREREPLQVLTETCRDKKAELWTVGPAGGPLRPIARWVRTAYCSDGQSFNLSLPGRTYRDLRIRMLGPHQIDNAACAVAAVERLRRSGLEIPDDAVRTGLHAARWPARFEIVGQNPWVVIDGAHNPESALALSRTYAELFGDRRATVVLGVLGDKQADAVICALARLAREVIVTTPNHPTRALPAETLGARIQASGLPVKVSPVPREAVARGLARAVTTDGVLLITGSLYLAGEARRLLG